MFFKAFFYLHFFSVLQNFVMQKKTPVMRLFCSHFISMLNQTKSRFDAFDLIVRTRSIKKKPEI
jgi:hypothetical protein